MFNRVTKRYREMPVPVKASIWFVICGVLKDAIDVLVTPVFTRILTPEEYGVFNVYNSWFQIVKIVFTLYLFSDVFNVGLVKFEKDRDRFASATLGFVTASVSVYFVIYLIIHNYAERIVGLPWYLILLLFAHVVVYVPYYCWIRRERFDYHYRNVVIVSVLYVVLQPVTALAAVLCLDIPLNPGHTRVIASVGIQIIIGAVLYTAMMFRGKTFYDGNYWKYSIRIGIELVPFHLSKVVLNQSDRIMINYFSGSGDTGIYSVAHSAAFVLLAVTEALDGVFVPWLYRRLKERELFGIKKLTSGLIALVAICVFGIDMIAPEIMKILGSKEYYEGVYCVPALVYSVYLIFLYTIFTNVELFYEKNIYVTIASSIGMIINVALNAIFIPRYGFIAAGYTTLVGYLVICLGNYILLKKCIAMENVRISNLLDMKVVLAVSALLLGFSFSCVLLYKWCVLRWVVIVVLTIILLATRKRWIGFIGDLKGDKKNG